MDPIELGVGLSVVIGTLGGVWFLVMLANALKKKWANPELPPAGEVQDLRRAISQLGAEVTELQERMDFAERLLTQREQARLEGD